MNLNLSVMYPPRLNFKLIHATKKTRFLCRYVYMKESLRFLRLDCVRTHRLKLVLRSEYHIASTIKTYILGTRRSRTTIGGSC